MSDAGHWYAVLIDRRRQLPPRKTVAQDADEASIDYRFVEMAACERIGDEGHETFCPTEMLWVRHARRAKRRRWVAYPMLPGYVFARFRSIPWHRFDHWPEMRGLVHFAGAPAIIPAVQIDALRAIDGTDVARVSSVETRRVVRPGDTVDVLRGPLAGQRLHVDEITAGSARALIAMLGTVHEVHVPVEMVETV